MSEGTLQQLLKLEEQRLHLHMQRQHSRDKEIEANTRLAEKSLEAQKEYLKTKPSQDRKTLLLISIIFIVLVAMFCVFLCYLLSTGNKDLAHSILIGLSHLAVGSGGYFAGTKMQKNPKSAADSDIQDADVVE
jgi:hypothetical protein